MAIPNVIHRYQAQARLTRLDEKQRNSLEERVNYYNKLSETIQLKSKKVTLKTLKKTGNTVYYFDLYKAFSYFDAKQPFAYVPGDVTHIPNAPSMVKSRPIRGDNQNSVLLKLNHIRHFNFVDDPLSYTEKKDLVVWRGAAYQSHRRVIIDQFYDHPLCDIGHTNTLHDLPPPKAFMSIENQLKHKMIICPEGQDVATNLKWAMSSNSLCLMSKPKYETWFMEGKLVANEHYVQLKDDYSDLPEKVEYFLAHPDEAQSIIDNAHQWVEQFKDKEQEELIELLVVQKYLSLVS
jgi:hypothetical protein